MSDLATEPSDNKVYYGVNFFGDTFRFVLRSLKFYQRLLQKDSEDLNLDEDLRELLSEKPERASVLDEEAKRISRIIEWYEEAKTKEGEDACDYDIGSLSHGTVRFTKTVGLLYLKYLRQKRNRIAQRPNFSKFLLEAIDSQLARYEEKVTAAGIFANASPIKLLVEEFESAELAAEGPPKGKLLGEDPKLIDTLDLTTPETGLLKLAEGQKPVHIVLDTIPILNPDLRARCLDLFVLFHEANQHERFDTVLSDATRILENRMAAILKLDGKTGDEMANIAFGSNSPKLLVSGVDAEQKGILLLFKGIFSHIRNPVHHRLQIGYTPERTLQIIGFIDYAIHVLETAVPSESPSTLPID